MRVPRRIRRQTGRFALVDGIPFELPVASRGSPALMALYPIDPERAQRLLPGNELHVVRLWRRALLIVTVIDYRHTVIGKYIEFSIAIACTHGPRPAPRLLPLLFQRFFHTGQYVVDLPVSTEVSVKGGKGIWGMPKHQASLDFVIGERTVSSQYDLDGEMVMRVEIERPRRENWPIRMSGANYSAFRGMLMKSYVYFGGRFGMRLKNDGARLTLGEHPRAQALRELGIAGRPLATLFLSESAGALDDYFESWFLTSDRPPQQGMEGMESVVDLGQSQEWPHPPRRLEEVRRAG